MSATMRRRLAALACSILIRALPPSLKAWGYAIRSEVDEIDDDTAAALFALDGFRSFVPHIVRNHLLQFFAALTGGKAPASGDKDDMSVQDALSRPRLTALACAAGALLLGLAYMAIAGAPLRYLAVNAGAFGIGLMALALARQLVLDGARWPSWASVAIAGALLATAVLAPRVEGAARWLNVGGLAFQPSFILLPVMLIAYSRSRDTLSTGAMIIAAAAMAIQPDRAMAAVLAAGLLILAAMRPGRLVAAALGSSLVGLALTFVQADTQPVSPFVDQILYSSFAVHALAGLAVLIGSALLVAPAILGGLADAGRRESYAVFGVVWVTAIGAAALGNYPTPMVGYSGSAVLGYVLSVVLLTARSRNKGERVGRTGGMASPHDPTPPPDLAYSG